MLMRITQALWGGYFAREWEHLRQSGRREASALNAPRQESHVISGLSLGTPIVCPKSARPIFNSSVDYQSIA
jgi:hypothetical protein